MYKIVLFSFFLLYSIKQFAQPKLQFAGQMKDVMWKGDLSGKIQLDTLSNLEYTYGMGPMASLKGEILLWNGVVYQSIIENNVDIKVIENKQVVAPFFGFGTVKVWNEILLPSDILTFDDLEIFLTSAVDKRETPFLFKLEGIVQTAHIHVVNLPEGVVVSSPQEAHIGKMNFIIENEKVKILGIFSKLHKTIFTHHNTFIHAHLITEDLKKMGHLDQLYINPKAIRMFIGVE